MSDGRIIEEQAAISDFFDKLGSNEKSRQIILKILNTPLETLYSNKNAVELLRKWISEEEWHELMKTGTLKIKSKGYENRNYLVGPSRTEIYDDKRKYSLCVHPDKAVPYADSLLTRIIILKENEDYLLSHANGGPVTGPVHHENHDGDARAMLRAQMETVDIARVGMISTPPLPFNVPMKLVDACILYGIAQARLDNIATTEAGLCVRGILPEHDFLMSGWRQGPYTDESRQVIYNTGIHTRNDRKVMILYGARNLKPAITSYAYGMEIRGGMLLSADTMYIQRANVKIIDVIDISGLQTGESIWFRTPILFKRCDDMLLKFGVPQPWAQGQYDNIQLLGLVIEALGSTMTG